MAAESDEKENDEKKRAIKKTIVKEIQQKTDKFLNTNLQPPTISQMVRWGLKASPNKLLIRTIASKIRESLPTVTGGQGDGRRTSKRVAGGVFRSPGNYLFLSTLQPQFQHGFQRI